MDDAPSDEELTVRAQSGDSPALGLLLARYQGDMRAVALGVLGFSADADDAAQDACLIALRRIGDVRDPAAIGPWLRAVTRNASRMRLRQAMGELPLDDPENVPASSPAPEQVVDGHALRDWIWQAMGDLPEPLQLTLMLRPGTARASRPWCGDRRSPGLAPRPRPCSRRGSARPAPVALGSADRARRARRGARLGAA